MATKQITMDNLKETIDSGEIVLLDFWASWCRPCQAFGPVFEAASEKHENIVFGKVNTEEEQELAAGFQITSIPTLMAFRDGIIVFAQPGALPASHLEKVIEAVEGLDMDDVRKKIEKQEAAGN